MCSDGMFRGLLVVECRTRDLPVAKHLSFASKADVFAATEVVFRNFLVIAT